MRHLLLAFVLFALAAPVAALADGSPPPAAVSACQAEYQQLGADAFKAKYGPDEPFGHCYAAHSDAQQTASPADECKAEYLKLGPDAFKAKYGATEPYAACLAAHGASTAPPAPPPTSSDAADQCKAEYLKLGPDAFKAKYGANEPYAACLAAHDGTAPAPAPAASGGDQPKQTSGNDAAKSVAQLLCKAEGKALGKDAFVAKYGKEALGQCVKATLAKARAVVAACKAKSGTSKDAFKACLAAAAAGPQPKRR